MVDGGWRVNVGGVDKYREGSGGGWGSNGMGGG